MNPSLSPFEQGLACGVVLGCALTLCLVVVAVGLLLELWQARGGRS